MPILQTLVIIGSATAFTVIGFVIGKWRDQTIWIATGLVFGIAIPLLVMGIAGHQVQRRDVPHNYPMVIYPGTKEYSPPGDMRRFAYKISDREIAFSSVSNGDMITKSKYDASEAPTVEVMSHTHVGPWPWYALFLPHEDEIVAFHWLR